MQTLSTIIKCSFGKWVEITDFLILMVLMQGWGVGVETGGGAGRSRPFLLESESELESIKFCRHQLRHSVAGQHPVTYDDFGRTVTHPAPQIIGRHEEKESDSV